MILQVPFGKLVDELKGKWKGYTGLLFKYWKYYNYVRLFKADQTSALWTELPTELYTISWNHSLVLDDRQVGNCQYLTHKLVPDSANATA